MRPFPRERASIIVVGLGYGDEAKGATVDFLASRIPDTVAVVRWSGGVNAAHNVMHGSRHHTFRQFGSATLLDVPTRMLAPMQVDPLGLSVEAEELRSIGVTDPYGLLTVDARCLVTTPFHAAMNRAREEDRGAERHGSCGVGIGETIGYALATQGIHCNLAYPDTRGRVLRAQHLRSVQELTLRLDDLAYAAERLGATRLPEVTATASAMHEVGQLLRLTDDADGDLARTMEAGTVLFEGSQGALLDEHAGFHPHTTFATTIPSVSTSRQREDSIQAVGLPRLGIRERLLHLGAEPYVLGLTRTYSTRHGAGPFPTEEPRQRFPEPHNGITYQGAWRQGPLDLGALEYAARTAEVDGVGVSHLDMPVSVVAETPGGYVDARGLQGRALEVTRETNLHRACQASPTLTPVGDSGELIERIERVTVAPVVVTADGPRRADRILC